MIRARWNVNFVTVDLSCDRQTIQRTKGQSLAKIKKKSFLPLSFHLILRTTGKY